MRKRLELTGKKFGEWEVLEFSHIDKKKQSVWKCKCSCGKIVEVVGYDLKKGKSTKCQDCSEFGKVIHGYTRKGKKTKEYKAWEGMIKRCNNKNSIDYKYYGGRGIQVDPEWEVFENFLRDVGYAPSKKHTIDRIDNNRDYEPGNVKWSTMKEQARNRRNNTILKYRNKEMTLAEWTEFLEVGRGFIYYRLKKGIPFEDIVEEAYSLLVKRICK